MMFAGVKGRGARKGVCCVLSSGARFRARGSIPGYDSLCALAGRTFCVLVNAVVGRKYAHEKLRGLKCGWEGGVGENCEYATDFR